jgi:hypothetical protein
VPNHNISPDDVKKARVAFEANEPRDLFYRAATLLVDMALRNPTPLTVAEALAVLLQTWNKAYYQYRKFDKSHFARIEELLSEYKPALATCRNRLISDMDEEEMPTIIKMFQAFETVLGPVGAAKALHLLAPGLFPLWDGAIAKAYDLTLAKAGSNGQRYWNFMLISQRQCRELQRDDPDCQNPLKSIDEYNYVTQTLKLPL